MDINEILMRSAELERRLIDLLVLRPDIDSDRIQCSKIMCSISFEHAESVKMLVAAGNFTSAIGLVRLQYDAFVRAMWLLYAASDIGVSKLLDDLSHESEKRADRLPMLSEMLEKLEGKAPKEALEMLLEFKEYSWKPLSSYIHGGIHAVHRHSKGYPIQLLIQVLKISNGLSTMVGMLVVILSGDGSLRGMIPAIQKEFSDSLPDPKAGHAF